jgi:hypothetical protein
VAQGERQSVTSVITLMELTVRPHQLERPAVAQQYEALLSYFPHLTMVDVDRAVVRLTASWPGGHAPAGGCGLSAIAPQGGPGGPALARVWLLGAA